MSKLIVEMEIPQHMCCDCEISIDGFACKKARTNGGKCPIKGVLPDEHGDLVDRDALKEKKVYSHERHEHVVPVACIDWQDAVIKAERKDDGTTAD